MSSWQHEPIAFGRWALYPATAELCLPLDDQDVDIDLAELGTLKRLAALLFVVVAWIEAEDLHDMCRALAAVLDPLRTLVPPASKQLGREEIRDRCMVLARRRAADAEVEARAGEGASKVYDLTST